MARISLAPRRSLVMRLGEWYSRRHYGKVLEPGLVFGHHPQVLRAYFSLEQKAIRWRELDQAHKHLAVMVTSASVGCRWCMDFGWWEADRIGLPKEKISKVPEWREHPYAFSESERLVMEYAEAMTYTPPDVTDELVNRLLEHFNEAAVVELTTMIALENLRARINSAMGLTSQGFSETCPVQAPGAVGSAGSAGSAE